MNQQLKYTKIMPNSKFLEISLDGQYLVECKHSNNIMLQILSQMDIFRTFCECEQLRMLRMHILGEYVALSKTNRNTLQIRYGLRNSN